MKRASLHQRTHGTRASRDHGCSIDVEGTRRASRDHGYSIDVLGTRASCDRGCSIDMLGAPTLGSSILVETDARMDHARC